MKLASLVLLVLASILTRAWAQELPEPSPDLGAMTEGEVDSTLFGDPDERSPLMETDPELARFVSHSPGDWSATPPPKSSQATPKRDAKDKGAKEPAFTGPRLGELKMQPMELDGGNPFGEVDLSRWRRDPRAAMRQANAERKLLLLWLTNSKLPGGERMGSELFEHTAFLKLAKDHIVRVRVDYGEDATASHPYGRQLLKSLGVLGFPRVFLFSPDKKKLWDRRGYRAGQFPIILGEIDAQVESHVANEKARLARLMADGFRQWSNFRRQTLFAKPVDLSWEKKTVTLRLLDGSLSSYPVIYLSDDDRTWLAEKLPPPRENDAPEATP